MQETIPLITNYNSFLSFKEKMPNEHFLNKLSVIVSVKVSHSKSLDFFCLFLQPLNWTSNLSASWYCQNTRTCSPSATTALKYSAKSSQVIQYVRTHHFLRCEAKY